MQEATTENANKDSLLAGFKTLSANETGELEAALLVAGVIDEQLDVSRVRQQIDALLAAAGESGVIDLDGLLAFCRAQGFRQASLAGVDLTHSSIDWLLQQHQGLPIVVAILIVTLARGLGMQAHGINYPGHFLLRVDNELIDPLALTVIQRDSLQTYPGVSADEMLSQASALTVGFRMLNNLKSYYMRLQNWPATLAVTEYQMAIVQEDTVLLCLVHFERGEYRHLMGDTNGALDEFVQCVAVGPENEVAKKAKERIVSLLEDRPNILH